MRILYSLFLCLIVLQAKAQCTATITAMGPTTFCAPDSVVLVANSGDTYQWFLNGSAISGATSDTLVVNASGSYEVEIDFSGCFDTSAAEVVTVNTVPAQPGPISGNTSVCSNSTQTYTVSPVPGATSYTWTKASIFGALNTTTTGPSFTGQVGYSATGNTPDAVLYVRANNSCGGGQPDSLPLFTYTPVMLGGMNNNLDVTDYMGAYCPEYSGLQTQLYANWHPNASGYSVATSYQWLRNGQVVPGGNGQFLPITKGGNYSVNISCGVCPVHLVKNPLPQCAPRANIYPKNSVTICQGSNITLNVFMDIDGYTGSGYYWDWTFNGTVIPGTTNQISITPANAGNYSVNIIHAACSTSLGSPISCNSSIFFRPNPVSVTFSNFIAPNVTVTQSGNVLTATPGFSSYQWYRNGLPIPNATSDTYTIVDPGQHNVVVNDGNMCTGLSREGLSVAEAGEIPYSFSVYPNPTSGKLRLSGRVPAEDRELQLTIYNSIGTRVLTSDIAIDNKLVDVNLDLENSVPTGVYLLLLKSDHFSQAFSFVRQ